MRNAHGTVCSVKTASLEFSLDRMKQRQVRRHEGRDPFYRHAVMHATLALAGASILTMGIGLIAWLWLHRRWPEIGGAVIQEVGTG